MFLAGDKLVSELTKSLGRQFDSSRVAQVGYELSLGDEIYRTNNKNGIKELIKENSQITIEPGQFALLLTKETITISDDIIGFISIKFGVKKKGLINISGFHVDPGFSGKIKFSVYNAGPTSITLDRDKPYFLIWLSELTSAAAKPYNGSHEGQKHIDGNDVNDLKGKIASPNVLLEMIKENKTHLTQVFWALGILITLVAAIGVNSYFKNTAYEDGYNFRIKEETLSRKVDSLARTKVDSILRLKQNQDDRVRITTDTLKRKEN